MLFKINYFLFFIFIFLFFPSTLTSYLIKDETHQHPISTIIILGGGINGERLRHACNLFKIGNGQDRIYLTGGNEDLFIHDRSRFLIGCGIQRDKIYIDKNLKNTKEEIDFIVNLKKKSIIVSDSLHAPRIHFLLSSYPRNEDTKIHVSCTNFKLNGNIVINLVYIKFAVRETGAMIKSIIQRLFNEIYYSLYK